MGFSHCLSLQGWSVFLWVVWFCLSSVWKCFSLPPQWHGGRIMWRYGATPSMWWRLRVRGTVWRWSRWGRTTQGHTASRLSTRRAELPAAPRSTSNQVRDGRISQHTKGGFTVRFGCYGDTFTSTYLNEDTWRRCSPWMLTHKTCFNPLPALLRLTFCLNDYKGLLELSIPTGAPRSDSCHGNPLILKGAELPPSVPGLKNADLPRHTKVPGVLKAGMAFRTRSKQNKYSFWRLL